MWNAVASCQQAYVALQCYICMLHVMTFQSSFGMHIKIFTTSSTSPPQCNITFE